MATRRSNLPRVIADAPKIWARLCSIAISASTIHYCKLRKFGAASHMSALEHALASLRDLAAQRVQLWLQAAHDLRGVIGAL